MKIGYTSRLLCWMRRNKFRIKLLDDRLCATHRQNNSLIINLLLEILERKLPVISATAKT